MVIKCTDPNGHRFHFIELEGENESYTEDVPGASIVKSRKREIRHAIFVCEIDGVIRKVPIIKE